MKKYIGTMFVTAVAAVFFAGTCFASGVLQVKGSDTLINLVQKLAEDYMAKSSG
ncbi:MAG: hypothetical protein HQL28_05945, partial [Candidatus Omnitrophica bacterium]|nr:hypothetical protein [Candidatus Omnitrophota bacterium]